MPRCELFRLFLPSLVADSPVFAPPTPPPCLVLLPPPSSTSPLLHSRLIPVGRVVKAADRFVALSHVQNIASVHVYVTGCLVLCAVFPCGRTCYLKKDENDQICAVHSP